MNPFNNCSLRFGLWNQHFHRTPSNTAKTHIINRIFGNGLNVVNLLFTASEHFAMGLKIGKFRPQITEIFQSASDLRLMRKTTDKFYRKAKNGTQHNKIKQ